MGNDYECPLCDMAHVEIVEGSEDFDECRCLLCGHEWTEYKTLDDFGDVE